MDDVQQNDDGRSEDGNHQQVEKQDPAHDPPEEWEKPFIEALVNEFGVIGKAAQAVGIHPKVVERRAKESASFAALYRAALQITYDALEYEAYRRALEPSERPVYQRGQLVGVVREWDNKHLQWMLERTNPERWHLPSRVEFGNTENEGAINFKLSLGPGASEGDAETQEPVEE